MRTTPMPSSSTRLPPVRKQTPSAPRQEWAWSQLNSRAPSDHDESSRAHRAAIRPYDLVKSLADRLLASLLFIGCLPLMLAAALVVKLTSRGPVVYSQIRLGRGGRPYWIY